MGMPLLANGWSVEWITCCQEAQLWVLDPGSSKSQECVVGVVAHVGFSHTAKEKNHGNGTVFGRKTMEINPFAIGFSDKTLKTAAKLGECPVKMSHGVLQCWIRVAGWGRS